MSNLITLQHPHSTNGRKQEQYLENKFFISLDFLRSNTFNGKNVFVRDWVFVRKETLFVKYGRGYLAKQRHFLGSCIMTSSESAGRGRAVSVLPGIPGAEQPGEPPAAPPPGPTPSSLLFFSPEFYYEQGHGIKSI